MTIQMVKFRQIYKDDKFLRYEYYPWVKTDKKPGITGVDLEVPIMFNT